MQLPRCPIKTDMKTLEECSKAELIAMMVRLEERIAELQAELAKSHKDSTVISFEARVGLRGGHLPSIAAC